MSCYWSVWCHLKNLLMLPYRVHSAGEGKAADGHSGGSQDGDQSAGLEGETLWNEKQLQLNIK